MIFDIETFTELAKDMLLVSEAHLALAKVLGHIRQHIIEQSVVVPDQDWNSLCEVFAGGQTALNHAQALMKAVLRANEEK